MQRVAERRPLTSLAGGRPDSAAAQGVPADSALPPRIRPGARPASRVIDLETTGLDPSTDEIISFATVTVSGGKVRLDDAALRVGPAAPDARRRDDPHPRAARGRPGGGAAPGGPARSDCSRPSPAGRSSPTSRRWSAASSSRARRARSAIAQPDRRHGRPRPGAEQAPPATRRPGASQSPLGTMANDLGLPAHRPHHADGDALTTAQAFIALATHLEAVGFETLGSLTGIRDETEPEARTARPAPRPVRLDPEPLALGIEQGLGRDLALDPAAEDLHRDGRAGLRLSEGR